MGGLPAAARVVRHAELNGVAEYQYQTVQIEAYLDTGNEICETSESLYDKFRDLVSAGGREESREPVEQRPQVHVVRGRRRQVRLDEEVDVVAADGRVGVPRNEAPQVGGKTLRPGQPIRDSMDHEHSKTNQVMEEMLMQLY